jgi:biotin/methionine sulfoxide reductase
MTQSDGLLTATHWGNFRVRVDSQGELEAVPSESDLSPSLIGRNLRATRNRDCRIARPMVREGYLRQGRNSDGSDRGRERFVALDWDEALDLAAEAIRDVRARRGDSAVYGSSYGWSSAGRFHHAQSQIHRFLRMGGGYMDSVNDYSAGAGQVIAPHVVGMSLYAACGEAPSAHDIAANCKLILCFGGLGLKNNQVSPGGIGSHGAEAHLRTLKQAGVHFISISAIRDDTADLLDAEWLPCRPNSDVALMLGLCHVLLVSNLHDRHFLAKYCHGFERVAEYLLGSKDGQPKDADWASQLTGIPAARIRELALRLSSERSIIGLSLSLQQDNTGSKPIGPAQRLRPCLDISDFRAAALSMVTAFSIRVSRSASA